MPVLLSFGLGKEVSVNAIIGKPTLKEWKGCVDFARDIFTCEELRVSFYMKYQMADLGLSKDVLFDSANFIRPTSVSAVGAHIVSIDRNSNDATVDSSKISDVISDTHTGGVFTRTVTSRQTE